MSNIKTAVETAISNIKQAANNPYSASTYTVGEVLMLLSSLLADTGPITGTVGTSVTHLNPPQTEAHLLTKSKVEFIVQRIVETLAETIENLRTDAVIDEDSIEMTISSGSISSYHISIDTDYLTRTILDESDIERAIWEALEDLEDEA
jgi:hypothetical protein